MLSRDSVSHPDRATARVPSSPAPLTIPPASPGVTAPVTAAPPVTAGPRLLDLVTSAERKSFPIATGVIDYFPDALAAVAQISFNGNQKHNPGQPLHHARGKSNDHADCVARHLAERGGFDPEGNRHSAQLAWRALALLQDELEVEKRLALPRGATAPGVELPRR